MSRRPPDSDQPTEKAKQGYKVPVPKRGDFFSNLRKIAKVSGKGSDSRGSKQ